MVDRVPHSLACALSAGALVIASALPVVAQAMKQPGEARIVANVVKTRPLEPTPELLAGLKLPQGFAIEPWRPA